MNRELMKQCLDAMSPLRDLIILRQACDALKAELAKPEPEPVAWLDPWTGKNVTTDYDAYGRHGIPLYTKGATNADNR